MSVAEEIIESLLQGHGRVGSEVFNSLVFCHPPFANDGGRISGILQDLGEEAILRTKVDRMPAPGPARILPNRAVTGMQTREQARSRRRTDCRSRIKIRKSNSLGGQLIENRREYFRLAVRTEIAVTKIIGDDQDNVGA